MGILKILKMNKLRYSLQRNSKRIIVMSVMRMRDKTFINLKINTNIIDSITMIMRNKCLLRDLSFKVYHKRERKEKH